jgi:radical SAM superfamily enzyme YgiQ (UPF0313 family)
MANNGNGNHNLGGSVKSMQDIMRQDAGVDGDAQRISQVVWMIFLKIFDAMEEEEEAENPKYRSPLPEKIRWRNWAKDPEGITGEELLDDKLLEKMALAGCYKLAFGIESGTPRILDYIGKCSDLDFIRDVFQRCRELGIDTKAFFTIGYPSETEEEIRRTIDFSLELDANEAYFMVVRAFPGTPLYDEMRKAGFSEEELGQYKQFQDEDGYVKYHVMNFRSLNGMPNEHLDNLVKEAYGRFYKREDCCV